MDKTVINDVIIISSSIIIINTNYTLYTVIHVKIGRLLLTITMSNLEQYIPLYWLKCVYNIILHCGRVANLTVLNYARCKICNSSSVKAHYLVKATGEWTTCGVLTHYAIIVNMA